MSAAGLVDCLGGVGVASEAGADGPDGLVGDDWREKGREKKEEEGERKS